MVYVQATASFFSKLFDINRTLTTVESFFLSEATFAFAQMSLKIIISANSKIWLSSHWLWLG